MSASAGGNPKVASPGGAGPRHKKDSSASKNRSRGKVVVVRVLKWGGGLTGAALLAFTTAYFTVLGNRAASEAPRPPSGEPVKVTVGEITEDGASMVLPSPVGLNAQQLSSLSSSADTPKSSYSDWFSSHKAAFVNSANIQLTVQGHRKNIVQIVNITPLVRCSQPLRGTLFYAPGQSDDVSTHLYFNLNDPQAPASYTKTDSATRYPNYFGNYTISLKYGEVYTFQIKTSVANRYCQFSFAIAGISDGKNFTESVNDDGQPFRVTSLLPEGSAANSVPSFAGYQDLYVAGAAAGYKQDKDGTNLWTRGNPNYYRDPLS